MTPPPQVTNPDVYQKAVDKVKKQVQRWPSAYASGMVVSEYKRAMAVLGQKPYKTAPAQKSKQLPHPPHPPHPPLPPLARWFAEKWIDIRTGKPCGAVHNKTYYPTCRPSIKITGQSPLIAAELTAAQKRKMIEQKQKAKEATVHYKETKRPHKNAAKAAKAAHSNKK